MKKRGWITCGVFLIIAIALLAKNGLSQSQPATAPETPETTVSTTTTTAATEPTEETALPGQLTFTGKVLEVDGDSVLMECYDKDKFDTVWVYVASTDATPQVGEEYIVTYEDMMMPSLPPRITAVTMEKK